MDIYIKDYIKSGQSIEDLIKPAVKDAGFLIRDIGWVVIHAKPGPFKKETGLADYYLSVYDKKGNFMTNMLA